MVKSCFLVIEDCPLHGFHKYYFSFHLIVAFLIKSVNSVSIDWASGQCAKINHFCRYFTS